MHRGICAFLLLFSLMTGQMNAAPSDWAAVQQLAPGQRIAVDLSTGGTVNGKLDHVTSDSVFVLRGSKTIEVKIADVDRLYSRKSGHGGRWALIGAAVGAAAGGAVGAGTMEREIGYAGAVAGTVVLFAAIGAGLGYAFGHGKSVLIYKAPPRKR